MKKWMSLLSVLALSGSLLSGCQSITASANQTETVELVETGENEVLAASDVKKIARVTGVPRPNETLPNPNQTPKNYQVHGTDLGIMWDKGDGEIFIAFGDLYGKGWSGHGAGPDTADWRSNLLAISDDKDPTDGLSISRMIEDTKGHAKEILTADRIRFEEWTEIPTAGVTVGERHYIHYMSINRWGEGGRWYTNSSGLAYSDDDGQTWTKSDDLIWENDKTYWDNHFQQAAFVKEEGYVYMFGTRSGRQGDVYLARVPEHNLLDMKKYRYWTGKNWVPKEEAAQPVVKGPAGELSVIYNTHFNKWIMTYSNPETNRLMMRSSDLLTGPWSGEHILLKQKDYPAAYGGFIHPWFNDGPEIYFNTTQWDPYNVFWMKAELTEDMFDGNMLTDPSFENQEVERNAKPWNFEGLGNIDFDKGLAHSGQNNAWLRAKTDWNAIKQTVVVEPNTNYTLTGWIRTSDHVHEGYLGARLPRSGEILGEVEFNKMLDYKRITVEFNSKNNNRIEVYAGMWAINGDKWVQIDDMSLTKKN